jgi:cell division septation protein DedD
LIWLANGNYYSFKEEAIKSHTPSVSGVYGLYNFRHQILIGNSPDIHSALLHHLRETNFRFRRFKPTGFTFEVCLPDSREIRTQELIREYDPILRAANIPIGLAALWRSWTTPSALAFHPQVASAKMLVINESKEDAANIGKKKPFTRFHFGREQFAMVSAGFGAIILAMILLMLSPHLKSALSMAWQISSIEKNWTLYPKGNTQIASLTLPPETAISPERSSQEAEAFDSNATLKTPRQAEIAIARPKPENSAASEPIPHNDSSPDRNKTSLAANREASQKPQIANKVEPKNAWAVQAMATANEHMASVWMEKLKAKGYDAFVVKDEIKGQTWYRVRVGHFSAREEAEALRTTLQSKEGFPFAFVAGSTKSDILIVLNP